MLVIWLLNLITQYTCSRICLRLEHIERNAVLTLIINGLLHSFSISDCSCLLNHLLITEGLWQLLMCHLRLKSLHISLFLLSRGLNLRIIIWLSCKHLLCSIRLKKGLLYWRSIDKIIEVIFLIDFWFTKWLQRP